MTCALLVDKKERVAGLLQRTQKLLNYFLHNPQEPDSGGGHDSETQVSYWNCAT